MKHTSIVMAVALLAGGIGGAVNAQPGSTIAIETSPGHAKAVQIKETTATIESVDVKKRHVMLRDAAGREHALVLGPEVRNVDQLKKGDKVMIKYKMTATSIEGPKTKADAKAKTDDKAKADTKARDRF